MGEPRPLASGDVRCEHCWPAVTADQYLESEPRFDRLLSVIRQKHPLAPRTRSSRLPDISRTLQVHRPQVDQAGTDSSEMRESYYSESTFYFQACPALKERNMIFSSSLACPFTLVIGSHGIMRGISGLLAGQSARPAASPPLDCFARAMARCHSARTTS